MRADLVVGDDTAGVPDHMGIALLQAEQPEHVQPRIHAGENGDVLPRRERQIASVERLRVVLGVLEQVIRRGHATSFELDNRLTIRIEVLVPEARAEGPCRSHPRARRSTAGTASRGAPPPRSRTSGRARSPRRCARTRSGSPCADRAARAHSIADARSADPTPRPRHSRATVIPSSPNPWRLRPTCTEPIDLLSGDGDERLVERPARGARLEIDRRLGRDSVALLCDRREQDGERQAVASSAGRITNVASGTAGS